MAIIRVRHFLNTYSEHVIFLRLYATFCVVCSYNNVVKQFTNFKTANILFLLSRFTVKERQVVHVYKLMRIVWSQNW